MSSHGTGFVFTYCQNNECNPTWMKSCSPHSPTPPLHANEIISPMSHLHLSRKASRTPLKLSLCSLSLPPPPRLALGPGQFGHHHCPIICLCRPAEASWLGHRTLLTYLTVVMIQFESCSLALCTEHVEEGSFLLLLWGAECRRCHTLYITWNP